MDAAMLCKVKNHQSRETCGESDNRKSKHACVVESHESTGKCSLIERGQFVEESHYILVHKFISMHRAMKIQEAKSFCGRVGEARHIASKAKYQGQEQKCIHKTSKYRKMATEILHENNGYGAKL